MNDIPAILSIAGPLVAIGIAWGMNRANVATMREAMSEIKTGFGEIRRAFDMLATANAGMVERVIGLAASVEAQAGEIRLQRDRYHELTNIVAGMKAIQDTDRHRREKAGSD